jgi:rubredoxin
MRSQRLVQYDHFFCDVCRKYVYDEYAGDAAIGIAPLTCIDMLPLSWQCPICGAGKDQLRASTMLDGFTYENTGNDRISKVAINNTTKAAS